MGLPAGVKSPWYGGHTVINGVQDVVSHVQNKYKGSINLAVKISKNIRTTLHNQVISMTAMSSNNRSTSQIRSIKGNEQHIERANFARILLSSEQSEKSRLTVNRQLVGATESSRDAMSISQSSHTSGDGIYYHEDMDFNQSPLNQYDEGFEEVDSDSSMSDAAEMDKCLNNEVYSNDEYLNGNWYGELGQSSDQHQSFESTWSLHHQQNIEMNTRITEPVLIHSNLPFTLEPSSSISPIKSHSYSGASIFSKSLLTLDQQPLANHIQVDSTLSECVSENEDHALFDSERATADLLNLEDSFYSKPSLIMNQNEFTRCQISDENEYNSTAAVSAQNRIKEELVKNRIQDETVKNIKISDNNSSIELPTNSNFDSISDIFAAFEEAQATRRLMTMLSTNHTDINSTQLTPTTGVGIKNIVSAYNDWLCVLANEVSLTRRTDWVTDVESKSLPSSEDIADLLKVLTSIHFRMPPPIYVI